MKKIIAFILTWMVLCITTAKSQTTNPQPEKRISVSLTISEWNVIFSALNEVPFKLSSPIINSIQTQAQQQLQPKQQPAKTDSLKNKRP